MKIGKYQVQLRHTGVEKFRKPYFSTSPYVVANIGVGRWFLAIRDANSQRHKSFFNLSFGRSQLRYFREEAACPWPGTDHYYGICGCVNKVPTHPRYIPAVWPLETTDELNKYRESNESS